MQTTSKNLNDLKNEIVKTKPEQEHRIKFFFTRKWMPIQIAWYMNTQLN